MTESTSNSNRRRIFSLRRRETQSHEQQIYGRQTGNIQSDEPVVIEESAVVTGNVTAPQIRVAGLLYGTAVTYDLILTSSGQIWGDVMAAQLQVEPGGQIQGWIGTISPDDPLPDEEKKPSVTARLPELPENTPATAVKTAPPSSAMRHLQSVAGKAQTDYAALKKEFDERLEARAHEAFEKAATFSKELQTLKRELRKVEKELDKAKTNLAEQEAVINQQSDELTEAEIKTKEQRQKLDDYKRSYEESVKEQEALLEAKNMTEMTLLETLKDVDDLNEQIRTLEATLQTSIRRTVEQEDALLHWQELAGKNQESINKLEKEAETLNRQLEENAVITGKLREKNGRLEFELQQALDEMNNLRNKLPDVTLEEMQFALADTRQQIATLNGLLEESRQTAAETEEQNMWLKANLQTVRRALEESRVIVTRQASLLEEIQAEKEGGEQTANKWKTAVEEMAARLQEKEKEFKSAQTQLTGQNQQFESEIDKLREEIQNKQLQIDAFENELENNLMQMDEQGQRLAEIQANLIEHELEIKQIGHELKQAKNKIAWQANFINKMKRISSETIADLESRLEQEKRRNELKTNEEL
ncbi:MAG: polymer-forming cytoskeletal protein [Ardenticatenaceae bacterium]|nr:polymer-forming cytoskeletal protein [Ardenticatenaceae bacterium]